MHADRLLRPLRPGARNGLSWDFSAVRQRCVERRFLSEADIRRSPEMHSITAEAGPVADRQLFIGAEDRTAAAERLGLVDFSPAAFGNANFVSCRSLGHSMAAATCRDRS